MKIRRKLILYHKIKIEALHVGGTIDYVSIILLSTRLSRTSCLVRALQQIRAQSRRHFVYWYTYSAQSILLIMTSCDINSGTDTQYSCISLQCILLAFFILNSCSKSKSGLLIKSSRLEMSEFRNYFTKI